MLSRFVSVRSVSIILAVVLILAGTTSIYFAGSNPQQSVSPGLNKNFITLKNAVLMDDDKEFRFFTLAASNLHQNEQLLSDMSNRFPDEFEIRDNINTFIQMGGTATRCFPLSYKAEGENVPVYVEGLGKYNEEAFKTLDQVLAIANEKGFRIIFPLIDSHSFGGWRGVKEFSGYLGKTGDDFFDDPDVMNAFQDVIKYLLNRKNTITGVVYKDDPTILAWQLGNELSSYIYDNKRHHGADGKPDPAKAEAWETKIAKWSAVMSETIKQQDPNHLVMEGGGNRVELLKDPNIDIISEHYYAYWNEMMGATTDLASINKSTRAACVTAGKALIADEFGMSETPILTALMDEILANGTSGGLLWGIRSHRRDGGFYQHNENGTKFNAYHWPGFPSGDGFDETIVLNQLRKNAFKIRGLEEAPISSPEGTPILLPITNNQDFKWRGSTGASSYILERSENKDGPWGVLTDKATDDSPTYSFYQDTTIKEGETFFYRVKAKNSSGQTDYSNVESLKFVNGVILDTMKDFSKTTSHTEGLAVVSDNAVKYEDDGDRMRSTKTSAEQSIVYKAQNTINSVIIDAYYDEKNTGIKIYTSIDGTDYQLLKVDQKSKILESGVTKVTYFGKTVGEVKNLKIVFPKVTSKTATGAQLGMVKYGIGTTQLDLRSGWNIDDFEAYADDAAIKSAFSRNGNGSPITVELDKVDKVSGNNSMKINYDTNPEGYSGVQRYFSQAASWEGGKGLSMAIKPDGSSNNLTIQFKEQSGEYWEGNITLEGTSWKVLEVPFDSFKNPSWGGKQNGIVDPSAITEFAFYFGKGSGSTAPKGSIWMDDFKVYGEPTTPDEPQEPDQTPAPTASPSPTATSSATVTITAAPTTAVSDNNQTGSIPNTGESNPFSLVLLGICFIVAGAGIYLVFGRK